MNKAKVMFKAKGAVERSTKHLRLYGMDAGVDSANGVIKELLDWVYDMGAGKDRPCPFDEIEIKRRIKW